MPNIILASTSLPRKRLLEKLKLPFSVAAPNVDETPLVNEHPKQMVQRLAKEKAQAVAQSYSQSLIIGSDQVGILGEEILGKPLTQENAVKQLQKISGKCIRFFTGLCLLNTQTQHNQIIVEEYDVYFRKLTLSQIESYIEKDQPLACAGSFQAEQLGIALVEKFVGNDFTALIGLPLIQLTTLLSNEGISVI